MLRAKRAALTAGLLACTIGTASPLLAKETGPAMREATAASVFEQVKDNAARLRVFVQAMPKGADLHNHISGSPYSEHYLQWAAQNGLCIDAEAGAIVPPPCAPGMEALDLGTRNPSLYDDMIDAMSTRAWQRGVGRNDITGHGQFFATFDKFGASAVAAPGKVLAYTMRYAAKDNVHYLELMHNPLPLVRAMIEGPDGMMDGADFATELARLRTELPALLAAASADIDAMVADARADLGCDTATPEPACAITVRFNMQVLREFEQRQVFRHMAFGFAMAQHDPRYFGTNIVQPEDGPVARRDYDLHMRMFRWLGEQFGGGLLTLHAGEFALGQVPPTDMEDHIAKAINVAGARRIGHGTAIAYETDAVNTLAKMAREGIAVEVNLSSNDVILDVRGEEHPMALYRTAGVPIVLSTDDEGVLRIDMSNEYHRAVTEHGFDYGDLKEVSRASLEYSFLPGNSLWSGRQLGTPVTACQADFLASSTKVTGACAQLLASSDKAREQWRLEQSFRSFETAVSTWVF